MSRDYNDLQQSPSGRTAKVSQGRNVMTGLTAPEQSQSHSADPLVNGPQSEHTRPQKQS